MSDDTRFRLRPPTRVCLAVAFAAVFTTLRVAAHDVALDVQWAPDGALEGRLVYSDAKAAGGNYVRVAAPQDPGFTPIALQTDARGAFRLPLRRDLAYEITASGDEGHQVAVAIEAMGRGADTAAQSSAPPIYLLLGAALLLSLPFAWRLRRPVDGQVR